MSSIITSFYHRMLRIGIVVISIVSLCFPVSAFALEDTTLYEQSLKDAFEKRVSETAPMENESDDEAAERIINQTKANEAAEDERQLEIIKAEKLIEYDENIKNFEKQLKRVRKLKMSVPVSATSILQKLKTAVAGVKNAQNVAEAKAAGFLQLADMLQELNMQMLVLNELEQFAPRLKKIDSMLTKLRAQLKKDKALSKRIAKALSLSAVDLYLADIENLLKVRNKAAELVATDFEQAEDFISTREDFREVQAALKKLKGKGSAVKAILGVEPLDKNALSKAYEEWQNARTELQTALAEFDQ